MRNVCVYLLKSLLIIFFIGCEKMIPSLEEPLVPLWKESLYEGSFTDDSQEPIRPAVLIEVAPTNCSIVQGIGGIVLSFNKKPENFKTDPPLEFYFADEAEGEFGDIQLQIFQKLKQFMLEYYPLDATVYITHTGIPLISQSDQVNRLIEVYWVPQGVMRSELPMDAGVSIIDVYWGTESSQQHARLGYILTGPE